MIVALFANSYYPYLSGITVSVKILREELEALGHEVFVVCPSYPGHKETDPHLLRLPSLPAPYPGYRLVVPYSYAVFKKLRAKKIDLIHAHQPFGVGLAGQLLARRLGIPFVYTFHTLFTRYVHHAAWLPQRLAKKVVAGYLTWFCNRCNSVVVPSEMVRRWLKVIRVKAPVTVIPTGLKLGEINKKADIRKPIADSRKALGLPETGKILLYTGRVAPEKNIPFLLKAFPEIKKQEPNIYLVLVGGGPSLAEITEIAGKVDRSILVVGQKSHGEVIDYCLAADLFVYASVTETQGLVLSEAKAAGLAVVAVFGGGIADVVESGIDGYLVPQNQKVFVEHVVRLLRDDQLRLKMGAKGREDSLARFSSIAVAKRFETLYNSLIQKHS